MKTAPSIQVNARNEIYTYIAIPIENLKQNLKSAAPSLKTAPNMILNVLSGDLEIKNEAEKSQAHVKEARPTVIEENNQTVNARQSVILTTKSKGDKSYKCETCGETKKLSEYRKHLEFHRKEKKFKCQQCSSSYSIEDNLKLHMIFHNKGKSACPICKKVFQRMASLKSHIKIHQVEEMFSCVECLAEFEREDDLNKHVDGHKNELSKKCKQKSLSCSLCNLEFQTQSELKEHVLYHKEVKKMIKKGKKHKKRIKREIDFPHSCNVCKKSFEKYCLLKRHMRIHTGEKPYTCHLCDSAFTQKGTLNIHLARHSGVKPFQCTLCPAKFCQKGNLRVHVQKTHHFKNPDEKMYKCSMCACIFTRASSLNAHITRNHVNANKDIEDITSVLNQLKKLEKQIDNRTNNEATSCQIKNEPLVSVSKESHIGKIKHVRFADSSIEGTIKQYLVEQRRGEDCYWYLCSFCSKEFKKPSDLLRHRRVHTREKPFKCKQCNQAFSLKSTLANHVNTHSGKGCHKCVICCKTFTSLGTLNAHLRRHDRNAAKSSEQYACNTCNKVFNSATKAKLHIDEHNLRMQMTNANVNANIQLKQPMLETNGGLVPVIPPRSKVGLKEIHSNFLRPHKCVVCGANFSGNGHLKRHILIHSEERKFKCNFCSKSFYSAYALKQHSNIHIGERKFGCKVCGKKFVTNAILKRHLAVHTSTKSYLCPYCKKRFKTVLLCRKHIKIHKRDINIQMHALNETEELPQAIELTSDTMEPINETLFTTALRNGSYNYLGLTFENDTLDEENESSTIIAKRDEVIASHNLQAPEVPITQDANQNNPSGHQLNTNYVEEEKLPDSMLPTNFETIDDAMNNLAQDNSAIFINFDDLQTLAASNYYSNCFSQLKNIDPLLMSEINEIQDTNVLFSTDPTLSLGDIQLDQQNFEGLMPFTLASNSSTVPNPFSNIVLSSNVDDNESNVSMSEKLEPCKEEPTKENVEENGPILGNILETSNGSKFLISGRKRDKTYENVDFKCCSCKKYLSDVQEIMKHTCSGKENKVACKDDVSKEDEESHPVEQEAEIKNLKTLSKMHRCSHCSKVFSTSETLKKHAITHKKKKKEASSNACIFCNKCFQKASDLQRHLRTHTGEKPFKCAMCDKSFSLKSTLYCHLQTHNPVGNKGFSCPVCSSNFSAKASLRVHMTLHTGVKPYKCTMCGERFRTPGHRKYHMTRHLNNPTKSKIAQVSSIIQSVIMDTTQTLEQVQDKNISTITTGSLTDAGELNFPSQTIQVDSLFLQELQLSNVLLDDETGEIPSFIQVDINNDGEITNVKPITEVQETELEEQTKSMKQVKKQVEKNFECDICHKKYSAKFVLTKHKKTHNNLNCAICDIKFTNLQSYNEHLKLHQTSQSFPCSLCENRFSLNKDLKTHMKRIHNLVS